MNDFSNNQILIDIMHDVKSALADVTVYVHATARDVSTLQRAYAKQERENAQLRDSTTRNLSVINAMRRELSELRAGDTRRERVAAGKSNAGLCIVTTHKYEAPIATTELAKVEPIFYVNGISDDNLHVSEASGAPNGLKRLPEGVTYELALRFAQLPIPKRIYWRGCKRAYGAIMDIFLLTGMLEHVGHGVGWNKRFTVGERVRWVGQWRGPNRAR